MATPLNRLIDFGQSFWLDNIRRGFTRGGDLARLISADGLRGETSNPTIFEKAVADSDDYDADIRDLIAARSSPEHIYDVLTTDDVRDACGVFASVYADTKGLDGFVSIELPPALAKDTNGSIVEARRLWALIGKPNLMVKVPATLEGMPVIRTLIGEGINVNITLMFGEEYYERVIDAYLAGLEDRRRKGLPLHGVASVASCFVSRIDTEADKRIAAAAAGGGERSAGLEALLGKIAIANSKRLYALYKRSIAGERFAKLEAAGARRQRPLWASTSTKNPKYPDTYYVDALIGPDTVDTMPPATIDAFRDHGTAAATLDRGYDEADAAIARLESAGISLRAITDKLLADGLVAFEQSYDQLIGVLGKKVAALC
ncbi:MAG TPA: transaldolase [Candidatus Eremiobacteraceae bacterium]|nr:transaldolase [Candidatus Eremiobacteraceae bacterium]